MPRAHLIRSCPVKRTARLMQLESLFDLPIEERSREEWDIDLPIESRDWSVGLIVGPSGAGKSTMASELFGASLRTGYDDWPRDMSVVDAFPRSVSIKDLTSMLTSVGFGSPPNWLRPFHVLSTGEQFRVTVARALLEDGDTAVIDEFTSVVDRQVAQIASHCIQKTVRAAKKRFVAVTCHYDVLEWLQPDWVYQPHLARFDWRSQRQRPGLDCYIHQVDRAAWRLFAKYHYLSGALHPAARCYGAFIDGECVAFASYLHFPHPRTQNIKQAHRIVVRPDYQGLGIGGRLNDWLGQYLYERGYRYHLTSAHPAMIASCGHSPRWRSLGPASSSAKGYQIHAGSVKSGPNANPSLAKRQAQLRRLSTATFEYVPPEKVEVLS